MGAGSDLGPHQSLFHPQQLRKQQREGVPANVVKAISSAGREMPARHPIFLEGANHAAGVIGFGFVQLAEYLPAIRFRLSDQIFQRFVGHFLSILS